MKVAYVSHALALTVALVSAGSSDFPDHVAKLMNDKVDPCDDFFEYACGGWVKDTVLPADKSSFAYSFDGLQDRTDVVLKELFESNVPSVSELYKSCMNTDALDKLGGAPLADNIKRIQEVKSLAEGFTLAGELKPEALDFFSDGYVAIDAKDSTKNVFHIGEGLLSLPAKSFYSGEEWEKFGPALREYVESIFSYAGLKEQAKAAADIVVKVELAVSEGMLDPSFGADNPEDAYKPLTVAEASKKYPLLVGSYFTGTGAFKIDALSPSATIINAAEPYLDAAESVVSKFTVEELRMYRWIDNATAALSTDFNMARFKLKESTLKGTPEPPARSKWCVNIVTTYLPDLVSKYYFEKASSPEAERTAKDMVKYVEAAMKDNINHAEWLDAATRANALKKLSTVSNLIGHPEHVKPLETPMGDDAFLANLLSLHKVSHAKSLAKVGKPVDKNEWGTAASAPNAYYSLQNNQMVFSIGIFQKPFFDPSFPTAENFGAIGAVVGHELTRAFDSDGRRYDSDGNLNDWWTAAVSQEYDARANCMKAQYSSFPVVGESGQVIAHVNGNTTIGENIADSGGVKLAYHAYHAFIKDHPEARRLQQQQQTPKKNHCDERNSTSCTPPAKGGAEYAGHTEAITAKSDNRPQNTPVPSYGGNKGHTAQTPTKNIPSTPTPTTRNIVNGSGSSNRSDLIVFPTVKPATKPTSMPMTGGSNDDKLFFISWAQNWCTKYRDAAVKNLIATNSHAPGMWRANGAVMNSKEFAETFQCAANKPMNPTKKCIVW